MPISIRVWVWHANELGSARTFALLVSLFAPVKRTGTITNLKISEVTYATQTPGICLAKSQLFQTYDSTTPTWPQSVTLAEKVPWSRSVNNNGMVGLLCEFTFSCEHSVTLRLRTVAATGSYGSFSDSLPPPWNPNRCGQHVRGSWPFSNIDIETGKSLDLNPDLTVGGAEDTVVAAAGGVDSALFPGTTDNPPTMTPNKGLYGVNATYKFSISNSNTQQAACWTLALARNNGGSSFGAGRVIEPSLLDAGGIPVLEYGIVNSSTIYFDDLVMLPGSTGSTPLRISVATGGGAALPMNLRIVALRSSGA